jgi:hypothetical protein
MEFDNMSRFAQWVLCEVMTEDDFNNIPGPYDFQLICNGKQVDFTRFFKHLESVLDAHIEHEATKMALNVAVSKERTAQELETRLYVMQEQINMMQNLIDTAFDTIRKGDN